MPPNLFQGPPQDLSGEPPSMSPLAKWLERASNTLLILALLGLALALSQRHEELLIQPTASLTPASLTPGSLPSTPPETAPPETASPETAPPETAPPETAPPETAPPEAAPPETAPPEAAPPETASPETAPPETAPPETAGVTSPVDDPALKAGSPDALQEELSASAEHDAVLSRGVFFVGEIPQEKADLNAKASLCFDSTDEPETLRLRATEDFSMRLSFDWGEGWREKSIHAMADEVEVRVLRRENSLCMELPSIALPNTPKEGRFSLELLVADQESARWVADTPSKTEVVLAEGASLWERVLCGILLFSMILKLLGWNARPHPDAPDPRREAAKKALGIGEHEERSKTWRWLKIPKLSAANAWGGHHPLIGLLLFIFVLLIPISMILTSLVMALLPSMQQSSPALFLQATSMLIVHLLVIYGVAWIHVRNDTDRSPWRFISLERALGATRSLVKSNIWLGLLGGFGLAIFANLLLGLMSGPEESSAMQEATRMPGSLLAISAMASLSPWYEELFFRGYLYGAGERKIGPLFSMLVSAGLFTLVHIPQHLGYLAPAIPILLVALTTSALRMKTGSTSMSFALHLGYNATLVIPFLILSSL